MLKRTLLSEARQQMAARVEFYKCFFADIGIYLVRSINAGFQNEELSVIPEARSDTCKKHDVLRPVSHEGSYILREKQNVLLPQVKV